MTLSRRDLIVSTFAVAAVGSSTAWASSKQAPLKSLRGKAVFDRLLKTAKTEGWSQLPIGERIGQIATALIGTPYVGHTLELDDSREYCVVDLEGLDCVTLFEDALDFARILRKPHPSADALIQEVRFTRYRGGIQGDYSSRLHYTKEWIADNVRKGVIEDLTPRLPGAEPFTQKVGFMSTHPEFYRQLKANPQLIPAIRRMEKEVNSVQSFYLPLDRIAEAEHLLKTGDIVGVTTRDPGIDIAHTGLCYCDPQGVIRFLDASSSRNKMKVTLENRLSEAVRWSDSLTGIVVARPLEIEK